MMRWWHELGVPAQADLQTVRRAYARAIKRYHPETHPREFQRLRAAWEQARDAARGRPATREPAPVAGTSLAVRDLFHRPMPGIGGEALNLLASVAWLFREPGKPYKQLRHWQSLFADPRLWNLECREQFSDGLFSILIGQLKSDEPRVTRISMSRDIWKLIDRELGWAQNEASLFVRFGAGNAEWVMRNVRRALGLTYFRAPAPGRADSRPAARPWSGSPGRGVPVAAWSLFAIGLVGLIRWLIS